MDTEIDTEHWLMPPMVGEVHEYKVLIMYEQAIKLPLTYNMRKNGKMVKSEMVHPMCGEPARIIIEVPEYGVYDITWKYNNHCVYKHRVNIDIEPTKFIFVSCDLLEAETKQRDSMWQTMTTELDFNDHICLFHLGDQAYMDGVFNEGLQLTRSRGRTNEVKNCIIRSYAHRYYDTWKPHHYILSQVSNYNIWDDHEIKNNVVLYNNNISENKIYVRTAAVEAYKKYQESMHISKNSFITEYSWYKYFGIDARTLVMAVERTSEDISVNQILMYIDSLTSAHKSTRLILCFSSPPIPPPHGNYGYLYRKITGDDGTPETSKFWPANNLAALYTGLFSWMKRYGGEVVVVGGDLHFGTLGVARCDNKEIPVIIASPITNQPTIERWLAAKGMHGRHIISHESNNIITFDTISSRARRCYATLNLKTKPMSAEMRYSRVKLPKSTLKYITKY